MDPHSFSITDPEAAERRAAIRAKLTPNDNSPELGPDGSPTNAQTGKEFPWIFDQVLKGYGLGMALRRFHWKIYQLCSHSGKLYLINDERISDAYGGVSRAFICAQRRKLREWNNGEYDGGVRHFSYISVKDNYYNPGTKEQIATGYEFSPSFHDLLNTIHKEMRSSRHYGNDWYRAAREAIEKCCREFKDHDFGYWRERKEKRPRSLDNILGTYLLNWKRMTRTAAEMMKSIGFADADITEKFNRLLHETLDSIFSGPVVAEGGIFVPDKYAAKIGMDKQQPIDSTLFWAKAMNYVEQREAAKAKGETVYARPQYSKKRDEDQNDWSTLQIPVGDVGRIGSVTSQNILGRGEPVERGPVDENGPALQPDAVMDNSRLRFLERYKKRE